MAINFGNIYPGSESFASEKTANSVDRRLQIFSERVGHQREQSLLVSELALKGRLETWCRETSQEGFTKRTEAAKRILEAQRTGITSLDLSGMGLTNLPDFFWELRKVQELNLSNNKFENVPTQIEYLKELRILNLSWNLLGLKRLNTGDLWHTEPLPDELWKLTLEKLNLSNTQLKSVPTGINKLVTHCIIDLSGNKITSTPPEMRELQSLHTVILNGNPCVSWPLYARLRSHIIRALSPHNYRAIALSRRTPSRPIDKFQQGLDNWLNKSPIGEREQREEAAKRIQAARNPGIVRERLSSLGIVSGPTNLDLSGLGLTDLPDVLSELKELRILNLSGNKLTSMPFHMTCLPKLNKLYLSHNQFVDFPLGIKSLAHLTLLDIRHYGPTNDAFDPATVDKYYSTPELPPGALYKDKGHRHPQWSCSHLEDRCHILTSRFTEESVPVWIIRSSPRLLNILKEDYCIWVESRLPSSAR
jgi:Leucine-rich repeat (LRR) protein